MKNKDESGLDECLICEENLTGKELESYTCDECKEWLDNLKNKKQ